MKPNPHTPRALIPGTCPAPAISTWRRLKTASLTVPFFLMAAGALLPSARAQVIWTGASGTDLNWLTPGNWSPSGPPGATSAVEFFNAGATNDTVSINNIVSASTTVQSLWYGQTNGVHNTLIAPGVALTVAGTGGGNVFAAGTETDNGSAQGETNTLSGPGGQLVVNNTNANFVVRQNSGSGGSNLRSTLDTSGLDALELTAAHIYVGSEGNFPRACGVWYMAKTNLITVSGSAPAIAIGGNGGGNHNSGNPSQVYLGQMNTINASSITVGWVKQTGNNFLGFNSAAVSPTVVFRGADGVGRVAQWNIADAGSGSGSGNTGGNCDFTGGSVDALVDAMILGNQVGSHSPSGTLTIAQGTFDVNTLILGHQTQSGANSATGTLNVNGTATLTVETNLALTQTAGGTGAASSTANLNLNGGTVNVLGTLTKGGGVENITVNGGLLNLPPHSALLANNVTVSAGVITNVDVLQASNTLTISGGVIASPLLFDMGGSGSAVWDVTGAPGGGLTVSNQFSGAGTVSGDLTMAPGSVLYPGGAGGVNPLYLYNNGTLDGTTLRLDLSNSGFSGSDSLQVSGNLTLGATNWVRLAALNGALDTVNPYTFINYYGVLTGGQTNFQVAGSIAQSRYTFAFSTSVANQIQLLVGGSGAASLLWTGDGTANLWDLKTTTNWLNGATPDAFYNLDNVTFDDTGSASPAVNLTGTLIPGSVVMSNTAKAYIFAGSGVLAGGNLTNYGTGGLTISNSATNSLNVVDIENGAVTFAGGTANALGAGGLVVDSPTAAVTIANTNANDFGPAGIYVNGGAVTFDQPADALLSSAIAGYGTLTKQNTNTLTVSGNNTSWSSPINVIGGTLKAGNVSALGGGGLFITNAGALDVNGQNLSAISSITASGAGPNGTGAIVNSAADQENAFKFLTLAGDTTLGGTGRWDVRGSSSSAATLSLNNGGYNLTKVGTNEVALVYCTVDPTLGNIDVQQGEFAVQTTTSQNSQPGGLGDPTKTITVHSGATLETYNLGAAYPVDKQIVLQDGATLQNDNNVSVWIGLITLQGNVLVNDNSVLMLSNVVSGVGGFTLAGGSTLILPATNTYSGATTVTNGTLQVDGAIGGSGVDVAGGRLTGIGSVAAPVTIETSGILSPGDGGVGTLSVPNTLTLAGTNQMDLDDTASVLTSDLITNVTTLTLGGTLQLNITGDTALAAGDSFTLYSATSITGTFTNIVPATPGAGLQWDTSQLSSGILKVATAATQPRFGGIAVAGGNVVINGSGGNVGGNYYVLTTTNLSLPLSSWTPVATNQFDSSGNFNFTNSVGGAPQQFYLIQQQ